MNNGPSFIGFSQQSHIERLRVENTKLKKRINEFLDHWDNADGTYLVVVENLRKAIKE